MPPLPRRPPPSPWTAQRLWSGLSVLSKKSHPSSRTSSFEADDERSSRTDSDSDSYMSSDVIGSLAVGHRYDGQDLRSTSAKELLGWYSYAFAAETYVVCGTFFGSPIPSLSSLVSPANVSSSDWYASPHQDALLMTLADLRVQDRLYPSF